MPLREERHPRRVPRRGRALLRWLPELLVLALVAAAFATQGFDLSDKIFGGHRAGPAAVSAPEGLDLPAVAPAAPVAEPRSPVAVDPAAVRRALAPYAGDPRLGKHVVLYVSDLGAGPHEGEVVYRRGTGPVTPASTLKLLTGAAALEALGPLTRFETTVRLDGDRVVLVGGGDPYLMSDLEEAEDLYPARADLDTLATRTASALTARGLRTVRLGYDTSLFTGPRVSPDWPATYLPEDVVPPITALWADQGKGPDGRYVADPAATAAAVFVKALARHGITVIGPVRAGRAGAGAPRIARISGAPVAEIVEHTVAVSDNNAAEVLAHQVGLSVAGQGSFLGGARAVRRVLSGLGVPLDGTRILDGSGLSRQDRLTPAALLGLLRTVASPTRSRLRAVITGLPVAGFTGSLQFRFDEGPEVAKGRVRAKTGTLTGVHGLAGLVTGADGTRMAFVAIADRVVPSDKYQAPAHLDLIAGVLGACRCGVAG